MQYFFLIITIICLPFKECGKPLQQVKQNKNAGVVDSFYVGADLSYVNQVADHGGQFLHEGQSTSAYRVFKDHGANLVRVRLWHDPSWIKDVYGSNSIPLYSGLEDVEKTIRLSKEQGMQVELDIHYSDSWADPGKQQAPAAWKKIKDPSVLRDSIYNYTYSTLMYLHEKGLMPEMVQVGNEINCGLFFTKAIEGFPIANACNGDWRLLGSYLNAGIKAVRDAGKISGTKSMIILHVADPKNIMKWFEKITTVGEVNDFDVVGISYYPLWHSTISLSMISEEILKYRRNFNKKVMIVETAYPWTPEGKDTYRNAFGSQKPIEGYPFTPEGQLKFLQELTREIKEGGGQGIIYWEPAWISSDMKDLWGKGSSWENATLFDFPGNALKGLDFMRAAR